MMQETASTIPTSDQKRDICLVLSLGCDYESAAKYVGCSLMELCQAMSQDRAFATEARRAEAASEMAHMRNVQNASRDEKHWRASVWWLERRAPERYGRRGADAVTERHLESLITQLVSAVMNEVQAEADRQRLLTRLFQIADTLDELFQNDDRASSRSPASATIAPPQNIASGFEVGETESDTDLK